MKTRNEKQISIADTTLRDGEQAPGAHLNPAQKRRIAAQLQRLGVDVIEAGFPASSPAEFEAVASIAGSLGRKTDSPVIQAFGRCYSTDVESALRAVSRAKKPRVHLFIASSDIHLTYKLRMTRPEAIAKAVEAVRLARRDMDQVQFSPEDAFRSDRAYLLSMVQAVVEAGANVINITDTVGYATPVEFGGLVRFLIGRVRSTRPLVWSVHCHDDLGLAVANTLAAIEAGATQAEVTVNGIGERAGNAALEEIVMALRTRSAIYRAKTRIRTEEIARTSRLVARSTGLVVAPNKAVVGANAFAHASGIHQDGLLKNKSTYEIMKPEDVGVAGTTLPLTARSGRAAVADRLRGLGLDMRDTAMDSFCKRFKQWADHRRWVTDPDLKRLWRDRGL